MPPRQLSTKVSPRSKRSIQQEAQNLRDALGIKIPHLPIVRIYEVLQHLDDLELAIEEDWHLPEEEAVTYPDLKTIRIRESVYDAACAGDARSRFTLAHELGHYFMHRDQNASFSRSGNHKIYFDCEWQADRFASELLIDRRLFTSDWSVEEIMQEFEVSQKAAEIALHDKKKEEGNG